MSNAFLYAITVLVWGSTWFAITFQLGVVPVEWSLVYRFALAAVISARALVDRELGQPDVSEVNPRSTGPSRIID